VKGELTRLWKKVEDDLLRSPEETMGFSNELTTLKQNFIIKKFDFSSLDQVEQIKKELMNRKILIVNTQDLLKSVDVTKLKRGIEDLKIFLREKGGSMARLGEQYLIMTPNSYIKISN